MANSHSVFAKQSKCFGNIHLNTFPQSHFPYVHDSRRVTFRTSKLR